MRKSFFLFMLVLASASFGQKIIRQADENGKRVVTFDGAPSPAQPPVKGAPYSAVERVSEVMTPNGQRIERRFFERTFRDSFGRTRVERPLAGARIAENFDPAALVIVEITDPIAGSLTVLDPANRIAHRIKLLAPGVPAEPEAPAPIANASLNSKGSSSVERLGKRVIAGASAEGEQLYVTPPGGQRSMASEIWRSPELKVPLYMRLIRPTVDTTREAVKLDRNEPDANLFRWPAEYKVVDEDQPFSIQYPKP